MTVKVQAEGYPIKVPLSHPWKIATVDMDRWDGFWSLCLSGRSLRPGRCWYLIVTRIHQTAT